MGAADSLFSQQVAAMRDFYLDPPLTKPSKRSRAAMKPLAPSTLATREKTLEEFVGFAVLWLRRKATIELVLRPLHVAKFFGFLQARGCALGTMKRAATHLGQTVTFAISDQCPRLGSWSPGWIEQVDDWYANLNSKLTAQLASHPTSYLDMDVTLWEAWQHAIAAWASFKEAFNLAGQSWSLDLARQCHDAGLRMLVVGCHQPPLRVGALRVVHSHSHLHPPCLFEGCRAPATCALNHVEYYRDRKGTHAELVLHHFKNEAMKGEQRLPLSPRLVEVVAMLEQAAKACRARSLFYNLSGEPYPGPYFSTVCGGLLTFRDQRCTANVVRHMFTTAWRDFTAHPKTQLLDLTIQQLDAATADLMLNSTDAWNATYDDATRARGLQVTLAMWPHFTNFVHEQHLDAASQAAWDPLAATLAALSL